MMDPYDAHLASLAATVAELQKLGRPHTIKEWDEAALLYVDMRDDVRGLIVECHKALEETS